MPADYSRETLYQVVLDRFSGSEGALNLPDPRRQARAWRRRCGGTLAGLTSRLDYIKELGASLIWISPLVTNADLPRWDGFHGYWALDFTRQDQRWGPPEHLDELLAKSKARGLGVVLDVVVNHTNPIDSKHAGALFVGDRKIADYGNDPEGIFHHNGFLDLGQAYEPTAWQTQNLHGLADLNQTNPWVDRHLKQAYTDWLERGFTGFRLDTARHVCPTWLSGFANHLWKRRPDALLFGEWWDGGADVEPAVEFARETGMHLTDFGLSRRLTGALLGQGFEPVADYLALDDRLPDPFSTVTFLDNHDMPRFLSQARSRGLSAAQARGRLEAGLALLMCLRGIPCIYYGTEQYLHQLTRPRGRAPGDDPYNREPMAGFSQRTPLFEMISRLAHLRRTHPAWGRHASEVLSVGPAHLVLKRHNLAIGVCLAGDLELALPAPVKATLWGAPATGSSLALGGSGFGVWELERS
ncbi:MAG: alpha-amylase family glycosyl hydrolase [Vulcanimicrobiota bacterium]